MSEDEKSQPDQSPAKPDEPAALGMLLSEDPRLELREQRFPVRAIVRAVIFGNVGETREGDRGVSEIHLGL